MKIALACVKQESNTFAPELAAWENFSIESGESLPSVYGETNTEMAGFLQEVRHLGSEPIPNIHLRSGRWPSEQDHLRQDKRSAYFTTQDIRL